MKKIAVVFPGQGSQKVGMAQDLYDQYPEARSVLDTFNTLTTPEEGLPLTDVMFQGPEDTLKETRYTQPAILAHSLAAWIVLKTKTGLTPSYTAGHSLGEYGALVASGVFDVPIAAQLIQKRAKLMHEAPAGAMSAVLGLTGAEVESVIRSLSQENIGTIAVANYNADAQTVISGEVQAVELAGTRLKEVGAKRVVPLPVGGAFHSPLMAQASEAFKTFVTTLPFQDTHIPVLTNVDAAPTKEASHFQSKLARQIQEPVRWTQTMAYLFEEAQINTLIEIGPGNVLTNLAKRMYPEVTLLNVSNVDTMEVAMEWCTSTETTPATV